MHGVAQTLAACAPCPQHVHSPQLHPPYRFAPPPAHRAERASRQKAASDFQALLEEAGLGPAASWDDFAARHEADPRFVAVAEEEVRAGHALLRHSQLVAT